MKPKFKVGDIVYFTDYSYSRLVFGGLQRYSRGINFFSENAKGPFKVVDFKRRRTSNFMRDKEIRNTIAVQSIADPQLVVATQKRFLEKHAPVWHREAYDA